MQSAAAIDIQAEDEGDAQWARVNLRHADGRPILDFANCLRILELHPDFKGRFRYNDTIAKVLDKGTVMVEWRLTAFVATLQERFLPAVPFDIVTRALVVVANRAGEKK